jgi:hypothetical protein
MGRFQWLQKLDNSGLQNISRAAFVRMRVLFISVVLSSLLLSVGSAGSENKKFEVLLAPSEVGYVSLVLGKSYIFSGGKRVDVSKGSAIHVGDRIYTESNGHVHVRFVDQALVSVRPLSTLEVERYEFDPVAPQKSAVKFNLIEGVARSISGEAAISARERFRLNTPVAAIGVRGTDFVVSASPRATRAIVNEGSIVMAPFSSFCSSDALGPCSQNAVELAGDTFQVIEIRGANVMPQVEAEQSPSAMVNLQDRFRLAGQDLATVNGDSDERDAATAYLEVTASDRVREVSASSSSLNVQEEPLIDFTPFERLSSADVDESQLVWGRFGVGKGDGERLSMERLVAAEGRNITIAASDYLLYRTEVAGARLESGLGTVGFNLDSAQAFYNAGSGEVALRVTSGSLDVNFISNSFVTTLNLEHALTGEIDFIGSGRVADGGYLIGLDDARSVIGAVATDAREAGYFFEQQLEAGFVSGLTLWGGR